MGSEGRRSSLFPILAILLVVVVPGGIWVAHRHAQFHFLEERMQGVAQPTGPRPGGRDPIVLRRGVSGSGPEFLSVTLLPGLGMDVLQITAAMPGGGEVPLLVAPTVEQMGDSTFLPGGGMNDTHGAIELPWSGGLEGLPNPIGTTETVSWNGKAVGVPTEAGVVEGGLLKARDADTVETKPVSGGIGATAQYSGTNFEEHWFSKTETKVSVTLQATSILLTVQARNVGDEAEPMGIGWHPRFAAMGGRRGEVTLRLPAGQRLEYEDKVRHITTGKMLAAGAGLEGLMGRGGVLGGLGLDEGLVVKGGAAAEIRDAAARYGLRVTGVSPSIREMRVYAPADLSYVSVGPQTNYDHPLGRGWMPGEAIATLEPGQTLEWTVRLEIFGVGR